VSLLVPNCDDAVGTVPLIVYRVLVFHSLDLDRVADDSVQARMGLLIRNNLRRQRNVIDVESRGCIEKDRTMDSSKVEIVKVVGLGCEAGRISVKKSNNVLKLLQYVWTCSIFMLTCTSQRYNEFTVRNSVEFWSRNYFWLYELTRYILFTNGNS
jgi:hypothetical protein